MRHSIVLLALAEAPISVGTINQVIESLPQRPGEFDEPAWQGAS